VTVMLRSTSRIRTNTIFFSLSGTRSIATDNPDRPGPGCTYSDTSVPQSMGSRRNRQIAAGCPGSPTAHAKTAWHASRMLSSE
jgi:hypothetical protein